MRSRQSIRLVTLLALTVLALALAACGDDESEPSSGEAQGTTEQSTAKPSGGEVLDVDAVENGPGQFAFDPKALNAKAGSVTVHMRNPQGNEAPHAIEVEGKGVEEEGDTVTAGGTSTVTVELEPGKYVFYCPVGDHRAQGMEGTLTVK